MNSPYRKKGSSQSKTERRCCCCCCCCVGMSGCCGPECDQTRDRPQSVAVVSGEEEECFKFKCVLLGNSGAGKSALAYRIMNDKFVGSTPTVGAAFYKAVVELNPQQDCDLEIWDTAGQERYRSLAEMYIRGAKAVIVVYDVCDRKSFEGVEYWLGQVRQFNKRYPPFFLVGNKIDKENKEVTEEEAHYTYKAHISAPHVHQVSALNGVGVNELVADIAEKANVFTNGNIYSSLNIKRAK